MKIINFSIRREYIEILVSERWKIKLKKPYRYFIAVGLILWNVLFFLNDHVCLGEFAKVAVYATVNNASTTPNGTIGQSGRRDARWSKVSVAVQWYRCNFIQSIQWFVNNDTALSRPVTPVEWIHYAWEEHGCSWSPLFRDKTGVLRSRANDGKALSSKTRSVSRFSFPFVPQSVIHVCSFFFSNLRFYRDSIEPCKIDGVIFLITRYENLRFFTIKKNSAQNRSTESNLHFDHE